MSALAPLLLAVILAAACRSAPTAPMPGAVSKPAKPASASTPSPSKASGAAEPIALSTASVKKGINTLAVAVHLYPLTHQHLGRLRRVNLTGRLPLPLVTPEEILEIYLDMMRRHFKSVALFDSREDIPPDGYDLHYGLDIHVIPAFVSGAKAEIHLTSHIRSPDGKMMEYINYDGVRKVPYPAKNMLREAAEEARVLTEIRIKESVGLAEYARTR